MVYSTEYIKEIKNKQKCIDKEQCSITSIKNKFIEDDSDNPVFNMFSFSVGPLLQVVNNYNY